MTGRNKGGNARSRGLRLKLQQIPCNDLVLLRKQLIRIPIRADQPAIQPLKPPRLPRQPDEKMATQLRIVHEICQTVRIHSSDKKP